MWNKQSKTGDRRKVRGGALKQIVPSRGRRENFWGISCEKSWYYAKKSYFFNCRGRRENFWGISCEKSRFYTNWCPRGRSRGGGGGPPPGPPPPKNWKKYDFLGENGDFSPQKPQQFSRPPAPGAIFLRAIRTDIALARLCSSDSHFKINWRS
jgi:hypothetical protein